MLSRLRRRRGSADPPDVEHRARAIAQVQRRLTNAEAFVALQEEAKEHLADGTLTLGRQTYAAPQVRKFKGETNKVVIGSFCSVAPDCVIYVGGNHNIAWVSTYGIREMFDLPGAFASGGQLSNGDVHIGHDCWIADRAVILSGITIGNGAVVAGYSLVTKDVEPYTIVGGNPARVIGRRFSEEQAAALERIAWWDWPLERIVEEVEWLNGASVDEFIARFDPLSGG